MTSPELLDLADRIATNTLTPRQQDILTTALLEIEPTFPRPDELSNSIPPGEEVLARIWISALYAIQQEGAGPPPPPAGITDVIGDPPTIVVTSPTASTRKVALGAGTQALLERLQVVFPEFTTNDNTTPVGWGSYTFPATPVPRSVTLLVTIKGTRQDGPIESQFYQYAVSYFWDGVAAAFSDGGFQDYAVLNPGGTADREDSISGATVTLTLKGPNSNPYTWTGYIQAFPDPVT